MSIEKKNIVVSLEETTKVQKYASLSNVREAHNRRAEFLPLNDVEENLLRIPDPKQADLLAASRSRDYAIMAIYDRLTPEQKEFFFLCAKEEEDPKHEYSCEWYWEGLHILERMVLTQKKNK